MEKVVTAVLRAPSLGGEEFRTRYLDEMAGFVSRSTSAVQRCIVNLVDVTPAVAGLDPATTDEPAYDAIVETWWDAVEDHGQLERLHAARDGVIARAFSYLVHEKVQKDHAQTWSAGQRSPGIKGIYAVVRHSDLKPEEFARHWHEVHGPLAVKHHVGMSKYVQDVVLRPISPGAPAFDGFSELHFPTARDMRERFVDSPEGGRLISQDVEKFVARAVRLDSSEYILAP